MSTLLWILLGGVAMSAIALSGSVTLLIPVPTLRRLLPVLVAFAAGSLIGGALFHMLPAALMDGEVARAMGWVAVGLLTFFALEQLLHWHHCKRADMACKKPLTYLVLLGDGLHNFLGGASIAGVFLTDARAGIAAWIAAAAHEVPQEIGDFAVLLEGGWRERSALLVNFASGLTFLLGALVAYAASRTLDVSALVPFAAGNFLYIGASDLVPEVNKPHTAGAGAANLVAFASGLGLLALIGAPGAR